MFYADVIVIGGGLAGLTAAYYILQKEPTLIVLVLEASGKYFKTYHYLASVCLKKKIIKIRYLLSLTFSIYTFLETFFFLLN